MNANEVELQLGARQCCHKQQGREGKGAGPAQQVPAMREYEQQQKKETTHTQLPRSFRCARSTGVYIISIWRPFQRRQRVASRRNGHLKDMPAGPASPALTSPLSPADSCFSLCRGRERERERCEKRNNIKICVYVLLYFLSFSFLLFAVVVKGMGKGEGGKAGSSAHF